MDEYTSTIMRLLMKIRTTENAEDACRWSQSVANLLNLTQTGVETVRGINLNYGEAKKNG
uniref:Uncharacterized protein n=1 Tax=viral metagenome TaxID=1070528 RepID=A0A6M3KAN4_9ZZZZ